MTSCIDSLTFSLSPYHVHDKQRAWVSTISTAFYVIPKNGIHRLMMWCACVVIPYSDIRSALPPDQWEGSDQSLKSCKETVALQSLKQKIENLIGKKTGIKGQKGYFRVCGIEPFMEKK